MAAYFHPWSSVCDGSFRLSVLERKAELYAARYEGIEFSVALLGMRGGPCTKVLCKASDEDHIFYGKCSVEGTRRPSSGPHRTA